MKHRDLLEQLNQLYGINETVKFTLGKGNLPYISITTPRATATISLLGGQVLSYQPANTEQDFLFVSNQAYFETGKAIKGGAPVCWPWFASHPDDESLPFHGLVRNQLWQVESTEHKENNEVVITLRFTDNEQTRKAWPYSFTLEEVITIGDKLGIQLITTNTNQQPFQITQAIHTYFRVGDINQVQISGLENKTYLDKVEQFKEKTQTGSINISGEVDRIYQHVDTSQLIEDNAWKRKIQITHSGSATCVVWNPWIDISQASKDLEDDDYEHFICVETANAAQDKITVEPGNSYALVAWYNLTE